MSDVTFAREWMLYLVPLAPAVLVAWWFGVRRARARAATLSRGSSPHPPYVAAILFSLAVVAAIGAAAQPRWGTRESRVPRTGADLVIVIDISRSMDARDVQPDRLQAAKVTINGVLNRLGGDRVGLVVFAGTAETRFPLTTDLSAARQVVATLQTGAIFVEGGSRAALGLEEALELLSDNPDAGRLILLLTDGDDLGGDPASSALKVQQSGADLLVAGVGTTEGGTIPVIDQNTRAELPKLGADGQPIISKLNEPFLRALAAASGGRYLGSDLTLVPGAVDGRVRALQRSQIDARPTILPIERYQVFAAGALGLLVLAALAERLARLRLRAGAALAIIVLLVSGCATEAYEANEAGREALRNGDPELAIEKFLEVQVERPDDPEVALNLAAAYAAAGRQQEAILSARRALASNRDGIRARAYASIGHHQFESERLDESLDAFRRSLLEDPSDPDSRHDYEVVLRLLFPELQPTEQPTPEPGDEGTQIPQGGATPGASPGPGDAGTPPAGTPTPGPGAGSGTPTPGAGSGEPNSIAELDRQLRQIDAEVARLLQEAGETLSAQESLEILRLLARRAEIASLRDSLSGSADPRDY